MDAACYFAHYTDAGARFVDQLPHLFVRGIRFANNIKSDPMRARRRYLQPALFFAALRTQARRMSVHLGADASLVSGRRNS